MSDPVFVKGALVGVASGLLLNLAIQWFRQRKSSSSTPQEDISTTSSSHSGNVYETDKAVAEYLMFHFGASKDILPYENGPKEALDFAVRTAQLCSAWCKTMKIPLDYALDIGCAVGGSSFEFSREFKHVVGVDYSHAFIAAANMLKEKGSATYTMTVEGKLTATHTAVVPAGIHKERIEFLQGDACHLPSSLGTKKYSVVHAANLLCRLPDPQLFLDSLPSLLVPNGLAIFISPFSWLSQYTEPKYWIGGYTDSKTNQPVWSKDGLEQRMNKLGFKLIHTENCPFLIREHARKFQWGCSHVTVFQLTK